MAYIGNAPGQSTQRITTTFTATQGQTSFNPVSGYTPGYADVYLNGVKLVDTNDYTATDGVTVVLNQGATLDDVVEVLAYVPRGLTDGYTKIEADARYATEAQGTLADSAVQPNDDVALGALSADGNLLVGKTAADGGVVGGEVRPNGEIYVTKTASDYQSTLKLRNIANAIGSVSSASFSTSTDTTGLSIGKHAAGYTSDPDLVFINQEKNADIAIYTNDTEAMRIGSSGNLLVGTTNDNAKLTLNQSGDETISIVDSRTATSGVFRSGITWRDFLNNPAGGIYYEHNEYFGTAPRSLVFKPAGASEKMRLSAAGQLRLGTSTENANILIRSEANTPWLNCTNNSEGAFGFHLYNDGTDQGTSVPFARMGINYSGTRNSSINFHRGTSSTGGFMAFTTNTDVERMRIDPSGYVTMPYQPAFWAWNSNIQSSEGPVVFVSTDLNNGGHYNTSTGRFTAPVSGIYEFQAMTLFRKEGTSGSGEITLYINGSNVNGRGLVYGGGGNADTTHHPLSFTYRRYLNVNDYAQLYIHDLSDAGSDMYLSSRLSWFSGRLIG